MPSGAANGLALCHTRIKNRGNGKARLGDWGTRDMEVDPFCGAVDLDTRQARICSRAGRQVNEHQPLLHAFSRTLKRLGIPHQAESGEPITVDRKLRVDITP